MHVTIWMISELKNFCKETNSFCYLCGTSGAAYAKLVAQKTKGMPVISISLTKLTGSAASAAIANLSLALFKAFKSTHELYIEGGNMFYVLMLDAVL